MIKLTLILIGSFIAFFVLPGALAGIAGIVFVAAFFGILFSVIGSLFSALGSVVSTVFGLIFSVISTLVLLVVLGVSIPVILLFAIPVGMFLLLGGLFCTVLCGVV